MRNQKQLSFWTSLRCAATGIGEAFRSQRNIRIQFAMTLITVVCGFAFQISRLEWCLITLSIAGVLVTEMINTSIEAVVDLASPEHHDLARTAKDVAAGAVLCAAGTAVVIGLLVFVPHLLEFIASLK